MALVLNSKSRHDVPNKTIPLVNNVLPSSDSKMKDKEKKVS